MVFRGGTALHTLFVKPPACYSEDIDLVQITSAPIGEMIDKIRAALSWLGEPTRKHTERSTKLIYRYLANDNTKRKFKIEINTIEHFHFFDLIDYEYAINNSWFNGEVLLKTYQLNEFRGTKLRAFYQRRKGKDLFDLWIVIKNKLVDPEKVVEIFAAHCKKVQQEITRALFEKSLFEKKFMTLFNAKLQLIFFKCRHK